MRGVNLIVLLLCRRARADGGPPGAGDGFQGLMERFLSRETPGAEPPLLAEKILYSRPRVLDDSEGEPADEARSSAGAEESRFRLPAWLFPAWLGRVGSLCVDFTAFAAICMCLEEMLSVFPNERHNWHRLVSVVLLALLDALFLAESSELCGVRWLAMLLFFLFSCNPLTEAGHQFGSTARVLLDGSWAELRALVGTGVVRAPQDGTIQWPLWWTQLLLFHLRSPRDYLTWPLHALLRGSSRLLGAEYTGVMSSCTAEWLDLAESALAIALVVQHAHDLWQLLTYHGYTLSAAAGEMPWVFYSCLNLCFSIKPGSWAGQLDLRSYQFVLVAIYAMDQLNKRDGGLTAMQKAVLLGTIACGALDLLSVHTPAFPFLHAATLAPLLLAALGARPGAHGTVFDIGSAAELLLSASPSAIYAAVDVRRACLCASNRRMAWEPWLLLGVLLWRYDPLATVARPLGDYLTSPFARRSLEWCLGQAGSLFLQTALNVLLRIAVYVAGWALCVSHLLTFRAWANRRGYTLLGAVKCVPLLLLGLLYCIFSFFCNLDTVLLYGALFAYRALSWCAYPIVRLVQLDPKWLAGCALGSSLLLDWTIGLGLLGLAGCAAGGAHIGMWALELRERRSSVQDDLLARTHRLGIDRFVRMYVQAPARALATSLPWQSALAAAARVQAWLARAARGRGQTSPSDSACGRAGGRRKEGGAKEGAGAAAPPSHARPAVASASAADAPALPSAGGKQPPPNGAGGARAGKRPQPHAQPPAQPPAQVHAAAHATAAGGAVAKGKGSRQAKAGKKGGAAAAAGWSSEPKLHAPKRSDSSPPPPPPPFQPPPLQPLPPPPPLQHAQPAHPQPPAARAPAPVAQPSGGGSELAAQLLQLSELYGQGLLTAAEFSAAKAAILNGAAPAGPPQQPPSHPPRPQLAAAQPGREEWDEVADPDSGCVICFDRRKTHAFIPADERARCLHKCVCESCAADLKRMPRSQWLCPMCRTPARDIQHVFE